MSEDPKYVVFKSEEFEKWFDGVHDADQDSCPLAILDAVVLRQQDIFAPPALDMYAGAIMVAVSLAAPGETVDSLRKLADFFHTKAEESWHMNRKIPD